MRELVLAPALCAFALPAFAEGLAIGQQLGTSTDTVQSALVAMSDDLRKLEMEDGMFETCAVEGKPMAEIDVSPTAGEIVRLGGNR